MVDDAMHVLQSERALGVFMFFAEFPSAHGVGRGSVGRDLDGLFRGASAMFYEAILTPVQSELNLAL